MSSLAITSWVRGDSASLEEDLHGGIRKPDIELFMDQLVRDAVVVMVHLDVIVDIDPGALPFGIDIGMNRQRFEDRFFKGFEQELTGSFELLKGAIIQSLQFFCDGLFELAEAQEGSVSQWSQNPVFHLEHSGFDLGLVLGFCHSGGNNDGLVTRCEIPAGGIEGRVVTAGGGV